MRAKVLALIFGLTFMPLHFVASGSTGAVGPATTGGEAMRSLTAAGVQGEKTTLTIAVSRDLQNLDPTISNSDAFTAEILDNVYRWLIDYELTTDANGNPVYDPNGFVGAIAESWQYNDDQSKLTFKIRENIKFANGDPIDAHAVKFTYDRVFDQGTTTASLIQMAKVAGKDSVKVVDDLTVEFTIDEPNTLLFGNIAQTGNAILNPKVVQQHMTAADPAAHEYLKANTGGSESGPYVLESWTPGVGFELARNPNWWGDPPQIERVIYRIVPDPTTRLSLLRSGEVDIAKELAPRDLLDLENDSNITVHRFPSRTVGFLGMKATTPPFDNVMVRQAISYAVPYETVINDVLYGYAQPLKSPIPAGMPTHTDEFFTYETDPERARQLLAEAGYPDGLEVTFTSRSDLAEDRAIAVWIKSALAEAGITVNIVEVDGAAFTAALQKHELDFFLHAGWNSINNDPFYHVFWLLQSECCNYTDYRNDEINDLIDRFTISTDEEGRAAASRRIQEIAVNEAAWVFLYQPDYVLVTGNHVKGVIFNPADRRWRYANMYIE